MRRVLSALLAAVVAVGPAFANPVTVKLWPGKVPGEKGNIGPERVIEPKATEKNPVMRVTDVSEPALVVYRPEKGKDNGTAVIIAPGGGYNILAWEHEGTQVAEWLNKLGVTGIVLKYRVPRRPDAPKDLPPVAALQDAQRAVSLVRSKAKEWGLKDDKIGLLGFSAGGHLTAWASTNYDKRAYEPVDAVDEISARPDFAVLIYSGGVLDKQSPDKLSGEIRVTGQTPPSFLVHAADDRPESSIVYFTALRKNNVPAEMHIYGSGGHGFGMRAIPHPVASWTARCEDWMRKQGYVP